MAIVDTHSIEAHTLHLMYREPKFAHFWKSFFMPPTEGAGGIMFPGCPSVRPDVRPDVFRLRDNSSITWWNFIKLGQKVKLDVTINWLEFEWDCVAGG